MLRQERAPVERMNPGDCNAETPPRTTMVSEVRETEINRSPVTWEEMRPIMREAPELPTKTWRPVTGGIFAMIAGIWNIIVGAGIILGSLSLNVVSPSFLWNYGSFALNGTSAGICLVVLGVISVIGGYSAANRRSWMPGRIGSIAALVPSPVILPFFFGVVSVILVALGRREFQERRNYKEAK